eukprot:10702505-Karenia_brevis.AAC.1
MSYEDLKEAVADYILRPIERENKPEVRLVTNRLGGFTPVNFPWREMTGTDNPTKHCIDYVEAYNGDVDMNVLTMAVRAANAEGDFARLPEPFGFRIAVPDDAKMQLG